MGHSISASIVAAFVITLDDALPMSTCHGTVQDDREGTEVKRSIHMILVFGVFMYVVGGSITMQVNVAIICFVWVVITDRNGSN